MIRDGGGPWRTTLGIILLLVSTTAAAQSRGLAPWPLPLLPVTADDVSMGDRSADQHAMAGYHALARGRREQAVAAFHAALAARPPLPADRRRQVAADLGLTLVGLGRPAEAIPPLREAARLDPDNAVIWKTIGYATLSAGDRTAAIGAFRTALPLTDDADTAAQLGYVLKDAGRRREAAQAFRTAIDRLDDARQAPDKGVLLRREVRDGEDRVDLSAYAFYRQDGLPDGALVGPTRALGQSQGSVAGAVRIPGPRLGAGRWIKAFGRTFWAFEQDRLAPQDDSVQAGVGLSAKPFGAANLVLAAERLIAVGRNARDDWLLRASWSAGRGYEGRPGQTRWPFWSVYLDGAIIDPADPDLFGAAETRAGWTFAVAGPLEVTPHGLISGLIQEDPFDTVSLLEAGPGATVTWRLGGDRYRAPGAALTLSAHYRFRIAGNADGGGGPTVTLAVGF